MISILLQLIAPDDCLECGQEGQLWCEWCRLSDEVLPSRCFKCHKQTDNYETCATCRRQTGLNQLHVAYEYKGIQKKLIQQLKFSSKRHAAKQIAATVESTLPYMTEEWIVTNVPTSPNRVRQRSFDHTQLIAHEVAKQKKLNYKPLLQKTNNTRQVGARKKQRLSQAKGSYRAVHLSNIQGSQIILVDDVVTTGASLSEASKVLKQAGAKQVVCAVFAYSR